MRRPPPRPADPVFVILALNRDFAEQLRDALAQALPGAELLIARSPGDAIVLLGANDRITAVFLAMRQDEISLGSLGRRLTQRGIRTIFISDGNTPGESGVSETLRWPLDPEQIETLRAPQRPRST
ncbi:hypothetical protein [Celeribacter indicus]|uniref:Uncharacterized protein n=1 Tax=Celeribacter indicus TaxID=1208324 RepID=A0A0B5DWQ6_9RHOB|nr:hypothetical protein [Celeribacter indicus]AJE45146.1 hypothetical protein P73_0431 [Celeribacter indicus]SDX26425.1 hypothetical protein SAMN05443573_11937 [Celeribacter indicus]